MIWIAWNKKSKIIVGWLGWRPSKAAIERQLEAYGVPKWIVPRQMTKKEVERQMKKQRKESGEI